MQRLHILRALILIVLTILIGRLYRLQLVNREVQQYGGAVEVSTTRYIPLHPRRGEIVASDGKTLLAESVPTFSIAVMPDSLPPEDTERRAEILGKLASISGMTSTLTLSPSIALETMPALRNDLTNLVGLPTMRSFEQHGDSLPTMLAFTIPPERTLDAFGMAQTYPSVLTFHNPIEPLLKNSNARRYQSVVIKENVSQDMALAVSENTTHLPGVVVVENYQRHYPLSASIPSLSHILGYIGRINECELVTENPSISWVDSLLDSIGHAPGCGVMKKRIDPSVIGILPYQNDDRIGKDGLELSYESELRGSMGIETLLVDALERPVSTNRVMHSVVDGGNLVLTIDPEFQLKTEIILRRWIAEGEARRERAEGYKRKYQPITNGVALVMDPNSGQILSLVSLPAYDNNVWVDPQRAGELHDLLSPDDPEKQKELARLSPLTNRIISGQYPPGSSLKQFVAAAALQKGVIGPDTRLRDPGKIVLEERTGQTFILPNSTPKDNGEITLSDALKVSSNVFFASIAGGNDAAVNLGPRDTRITGLTITGLAEGLEWFGFGKPTMVQLPGEASGRVPNPIWKSHQLREPWTTGDTYNTAIGQGYLEVTPLQLITGATAVANGGTIYRPQLVKHITDSSGNVTQVITPEIQAKVPVDPPYLAVIREGMRRSVTEGSNVAARDECSGLSIAGKTGTAEFGPLIAKEDGGFARQSHSWFVGFAPYENPQVIVVVLIEGTGDLNDGSATLAVPAVTQIIQAYFGVAPPEKPASFCPSLPQ